MESASLAADSVGAGSGAVAQTDDVVVDHATLKIVDMGHTGTGYTVRLVGRIDEPWIRCFRSIQADSRHFSRFVLDPIGWKVSFLRRADDGPADVIENLQTLDTFVARVNRFARSFVLESLG